ncbi:MAG: redox-regulated ATPase YchF [Nitrospirae bacterium]|nr:redox-regulated ATPase YchF [Nitrospirota bacterium]
MALNCGIVGLPNVGKSTIFNAMTAAGAESANYPFCTIDPNVGIVALNDPRLLTLQKAFGSKRMVPATVEFVDIAGLVAGASKGEGLGNQFLGHIRETDAILHVVRCFEDTQVIHVEGSVDPTRDIATIDLELILADMDSLTRRKSRVEKKARSGEKDAKADLAATEKVLALLEAGEPARKADLTDDERAILKDAHLITLKPVLFVANVAEDMLGKPNPLVEQVERIAKEQGAQVVAISGAIESELATLDAADRQDYLADLGVEEAGLDRLAHAAYALLGRITYFTAGPQEARAWTVRKGTLAPAAAAEIHSDIERGFIRAEVAAFEDVAAIGPWQPLKDAGKVRLEGKDYVVQDGDVIYFRFNV